MTEPIEEPPPPLFVVEPKPYVLKPPNMVAFQVTNNDIPVLEIINTWVVANLPEGWQSAVLPNFRVIQFGEIGNPFQYRCYQDQWICKGEDGKLFVLDPHVQPALYNAVVTPAPE